MTLIRSLAEDDKRTILISSHQLYQIQQICDRVGLFVDGRLIACGRIDELAGQMRREGHYALEAAAFPDDSGFEELLRTWQCGAGGADRRFLCSPFQVRPVQGVKPQDPGKGYTCAT